MIVLYRDRSVGTFLGAYTAAYTASAADLSCYLSQVSGRTGNFYFLLLWTDYDQVVGTFLGAKSAANAFGGIHHGYSVYNGNSVLGTHPYAVAVSETAACAGLLTVIKSVARRA